MMSGFTKGFVLENISKNKWRLKNDFTYHTSIPYDENLVTGSKNPYFITVPSGLVTDFSTAPNIACFRVNPYDKVAKPFVLHYFMYKQKMFPRHICDKILFESIISIGINNIKAYAYYFYVRLFSGEHYG